MALRGILAAVLCAASLVVAGASRADQYRPEEFFSLDLQKAVFSPKPLGPAARFEPVRVQARTEFASKPVHTTPVHAEAMPKAAARIRAVHAEAKAAPRIRTVHAEAKPKVAAKIRTVHAPPSKPPPHVKLARHRNPLDAQASDTRVQVWPCRSGGICNWQRPGQ